MKYGLHIRDPCPPSGSGGEVCFWVLSLLRFLQFSVHCSASACSESISKKLAL